MSNVIKACSIRYEPNIKVILDYKERDKEIQAKLTSKLSQLQNEEGFEGGLQAVVVDPVVSEEEQKLKAGAIIENAQKEAAKILEAAKDEAKKLQEETKKKAQKQGYEEGIKKGELEIRQIKDNLNIQQKRQEEEYQEVIAEISDQVTELMISLITKLTGILIEDKSEIIFYLVQKALEDNDSVEDYTIRVSTEDMDFISSKKESIEEIIEQEIQIISDPQLKKNQCLIETESKIIDCSLDVQLNNLITDLKLLSSV